MTNLPVVEGRSCGECTKCCEGYLEGNIRGQEMTLGKPCFLVEIGKGCTDYENRPEHPCKTFQCEWLINSDIPIEFKPSFSKVIISEKNINNIKYLELIEAGEKLDSKILSWTINYSFEKDKNILWNVDDEMYNIGDDDFENLINNLYPLEENN
jgi:hypothetical protein